MAIGRALLRVRGANRSAVNVMLVITHPMHSGNRRNKKTKKKIPAHFITGVDFFHNGGKFAHLTVGPAVSRNPFFRVFLKGPASGTISAQFRDNRGGSWTKSKSV